MEENSLSPEEDLIKQFNSVSDALVRVIERCEDARQFAGVARLAIRNNETEMALLLLETMISRLNVILQEYDDVADEELVDIVTKKLNG